MKLPRAKITIGRLMVAVAVAAFALAWWFGRIPRRREGFVYMAITHRQRIVDPAGYHARMAAKYDWAARHPWLPTWPEPPAPEPDDVVDCPWPL